MGEAKVGEQFVTHEFDEAISIQRTIVEAEERLAAVHPQPEGKRLMQRGLKEDQKFLRQLEQLGREHGASGKVEEVAGGLQQLMQTTLQTAGQAEGGAHGADAVLL